MVKKPTWTLALIKVLAAADLYSVDIAAQAGAAVHKCTIKDIVACIRYVLSEEHFYKTMVSRQWSNVHFDVYKCPYKGVLWYIKIAAAANHLHVFSFKEHNCGVSALRKKGRGSQRPIKTDLSRGKASAPKC